MKIDVKAFVNKISQTIFKLNYYKLKEKKWKINRKFFNFLIIIKFKLLNFNNSTAKIKFI